MKHRPLVCLAVGLASLPALAEDTPNKGIGFHADTTTYGANYQGRRLSVREWSAGFDFDQRFGITYGRQVVGVRGRSATSRFDTLVDFYRVDAGVYRGARGKLDFSYQATRPGQGQAVTTNSSATYFEPKLDGILLSYTAPAVDRATWRRPNWGLSAGYTKTEVATASSRTMSLGGHGSIDLNSWLEANAEANVYLESTTGLRRLGTGAKTLLGGGLTVKPLTWLRISGNAFVFPGGVPFAGTHLAGLSSFLLYEPGGAVEGLRRDSLAYFTLRLEARFRF